MNRILLLCSWMAAGLVAVDRVQAQCGQWTAPLNISKDAGNFAVDGHLAIDAAGNVHIIYQSFLDSVGRTYYVTNAGGSWSTPLQLGSMNGKGSAPRILITPADQRLHAFFGKGTLYYRSKPASGGSWSPAEQVSVNPNQGFIQGATVDSSGGIYFLYGQLFDNSAPVRNGIYGRYKPFGGAWGATEVIYGNSQDGNWPRGEQIIARGTTLWVSIGVDGGMFYKKKPATGSWPAGRGTQFAESGGGLRFAMDPNSNEIAAMWTRSLPCTDPCEDDPWFEVDVKYSTDDGASWSGTFNISDMVADIDRTPSGVYDANGNLHVMWEGFCCDHKLRMRYRGRVNGIWGPIHQLSDLSGGATPEAIATHGLDVYAAISNTGTNIGLYDVMFTSLTGSLPWMNVNKTSLSHTINIGGSVPNDSFTVFNGCAGTLNYTVTANAPWLSVSPGSGSSSGEADTITVSFPGAEQLTAGTHQALITLSGNATNAPKTVAVSLRVNTVGVDTDGDGDVDQTDFGRFQACLTGPNVPQFLGECQFARIDADSDVDQADFIKFAGCMTEPGVIADPNCLN